MLDTVKINHVQHISFTQSRLTDAVSVILSELLSYEHPAKGAGLFLLSKAVNLKLPAGNGTVAFAEGQLRRPALPKRGARDITVAYVH